ncbi:putative transcription factor B3-Domain family [Helianthus anomalus]
MDVFFFQIQQENWENVFSTSVFHQSPRNSWLYMKSFARLGSAVDNNNAVIRCVNDKTWLEKVVADLSLSEGMVLVFRKIGPYTFLLTPFMKVAPYQHCQQKFVMFSAISSFVHKKYIESFCHFVNENTVERLLLPTDFVKNTIGVSKLKGAMKVYINAWNWFDVFIEKDRISKCYVFGDGWKKVVGFLGFDEKCVFAIRYLFDYNFHLTLFDVH